MRRSEVRQPRQHLRQPHHRELPHREAAGEPLGRHRRRRPRPRPPAPRRRAPAAPRSAPPPGGRPTARPPPETAAPPCQLRSPVLPTARRAGVKGRASGRGPCARLTRSDRPHAVVARHRVFGSFRRIGSRLARVRSREVAITFLQKLDASVCLLLPQPSPSSGRQSFGPSLRRRLVRGGQASAPRSGSADPPTACCRSASRASGPAVPVVLRLLCRGSRHIRRLLESLGRIRGRGGRFSAPH